MRTTRTTLCVPADRFPDGVPAPGESPAPRSGQKQSAREVGPKNAAVWCVPFRLDCSVPSVYSINYRRKTKKRPRSLCGSSVGPSSRWEQLLLMVSLQLKWCVVVDTPLLKYGANATVYGFTALSMSLVHGANATALRPKCRRHVVGVAF
eukprot:scaffold98155_cov72-Phaeocystis_antarctica.AAC.2